MAKVYKKSQPSNYRLALDLEQNQPSGRIVQIGAVVGDIVTGQVAEHLSCLVRPGEPLAEEIIKLTGITEEALAESGMSLSQAYQELVSLSQRWGCDSIPLIWNAGLRGNDVLELYEQLQSAVYAFPGEEERFLFTSWRDVKALYQEYCAANNMSPRSGLAKSLVRVGMTFEGRIHDAMYDALNTFRMAHFINRLLVDPLVTSAKGRPVKLPPAAPKKVKELKRPEEAAKKLAALISEASAQLSAAHAAHAAPAHATERAAGGEESLALAHADGQQVVLAFPGKAGSQERTLSLAEAGRYLASLRRLAAGKS